MTELKTLKEYFEIGKGKKTKIDKGSFAYSGICWKCKSKVGKKSLEPYSALCFSCLQKVIESDLRAEAIKWIKGMENARYGDGENFKERLKGFEDFYDDEYDSFSEVINWIKHFFNITDEDLK